MNFDEPGSEVVRAFVVHNALYWLEEFHLDGLRIDAAHSMVDTSPVHILEELGRAVADGPARDRPVHLVLENDDNDARLLARPAPGARPLYQAQWNDDVHHVLHVLVTGEVASYYADYDPPIAHLGRCLTQGFSYQGDPSPHRGRPRGEPSASLPPTAFVGFLQNHDQIGNRAFGERITAIAPAEAVRAATAVLLLAPALPLLFMGQEWAAREPFLYWSDLSGEFGAQVAEGRRQRVRTLPRILHAREPGAHPGPAVSRRPPGAPCSTGIASAGPCTSSGSPSTARSCRCARRRSRRSSPASPFPRLGGRRSARPPSRPYGRSPAGRRSGSSPISAPPPRRMAARRRTGGGGSTGSASQHDAWESLPAWSVGWYLDERAHDPTLTTAGLVVRDGISIDGERALGDALPAELRLDALGGPRAEARRALGIAAERAHRGGERGSGRPAARGRRSRRPRPPRGCRRRGSPRRPCRTPSPRG